VERVGRHDHFFELGGNSLLAIQVVNLLKQAGFEIMVADVFTHPTIESIADVAANDGRPIKQRLMDKAIPIRKEGTEHPLFLLPHGGPAGLVYASILTPYLNPNIPVFALPLDIYAPTETISGYLTIPAMAARMLLMIHAVQPVGPYRVAGASFGGIIAYEVATQLIAEDEKIEFLGLFDTQYPADKTAFPEHSNEEKVQLLDEIGWWASEDKNLLSTISELKPKAETMDFASLLKICEELKLLPGHLSHLATTKVQYYLANKHARYVAKNQYHATYLPISIYLFAAQDRNTIYAEDIDTTDSCRGWGSVLPKSKIHVIPIAGSHATMFDASNLEALGKVLSHAINKAVLS
jgi:arthrofactin-type cyclic lipopeptide synthetase C